MWLDQLAQNLELDRTSHRHFGLCLSGGLDSTVMAFGMAQIRTSFPVQIEALHLNFGLRGKDSDRDEEAVRRLCQELKIPLKVKKVRLKKTTSVQDQARSARLQAIGEWLPSVEVLEAHHQGDQVETFFLNLFRGAGLRGLSSLKMKSKREGRLVWRPMLSFSKDDLDSIARKSRLKWREDKSNQLIVYDRNFVRLKILPLVEKRFPAYRGSVLSSIALLQTLETEALRNFEAKWNERGTVLQAEPLSLNLAAIASWSDFERMNFFYYLFSQRLKIQVSRLVLQKLSALCLLRPPGSVNLPKGIVARVRSRQRLIFDGLKGVLGDDKSTLGIILKAKS